MKLSLTFLLVQTPCIYYQKLVHFMFNKWNISFTSQQRYIAWIHWVKTRFGSELFDAIFIYGIIQIGPKTGLAPVPESTENMHHSWW